MTNKLIKWSEPTRKQRLAKARFWDRMQTTFRDPHSLSMQEVCELSGMSSLGKHMSDPKFQAWFFNSNNAQHMIMSGAEMAVERLVDVLSMPIDPETGITAPAVIKSAEILMKYAGMEPAKKIEATTDSMANMKPEEMKEFLKTHMKRLLATLTPAEKDELMGIHTHTIAEGDVNEK